MMPHFTLTYMFNIFYRFSPKFILLITLIVNASAVTFFAISDTVALMLVFRFIIGMSQAFLVIYGPVWVDEFSPLKSKTLWMSLMQGG